MRRLVVAAALSLVWASRTAAQLSPVSPPERKTLRGVVYDSLARKPLGDAIVRVAGAPAFVTTDSKGRFHVDSIAVGVLTVTVEHPMLDSIGLYELSVRVTHDGRREPTLAVPSFPTMSRALCGRAVTGDSAMVYGTLLDPTAAPARNARVQFSWIAVRMAMGAVAPQRFQYETRTDSLGRFAACALPFDEPLELHAVHDVTADWALTMAIPAQHARVLRQELMLSVTADVQTVRADDSTAVPQPPRGPRGVVRGVVQGVDGEPVANAVVYIGGLAELRADQNGRFLALDIPVGSHQIEAFAIGRLPQSRVASVRAGDTARVTLALEKITTLTAVRTQATAGTAAALLVGIEERRRQGFGYVRDSAEIGRMPSLSSVLATFPSVVSRPGRGGIPIVLLPAPMSGGQCQARLFVDGRPDTWERAASMLPKDIAYMEVFPRGTLQPFEFQPPMGVGCGSVHLVTKSRVSP